MIVVVIVCSTVDESKAFDHRTMCRVCKIEPDATHRIKSHAQTIWVIRICGMASHDERAVAGSASIPGTYGNPLRDADAVCKLHPVAIFINGRATLVIPSRSDKNDIVRFGMIHTVLDRLERLLP